LRLAGKWNNKQSNKEKGEKRKKSNPVQSGPAITLDTGCIGNISKIPIMGLIV
jgi:hypothetical protein